MKWKPHRCYVTPRKVWRYDHANFPLANELLSNLDPTESLVDDNPSASWSNWCKAFLELMDKCIPNASLPKRRNLPWLSKQNVQLMKKKNTLFRKSKTCLSLLPKYRKLRNVVTQALNPSKNKFFSTLKKSSKKFWKAVNSLNRGTNSIRTLFGDDGTPASSPVSKAMLLNLCFSRNFNTSTPPVMVLPVPPFPWPDNILCCEEKIWGLICLLGVSKAMGLTKYQLTCWRRLHTLLRPWLLRSLTCLFNWCIPW